MEYLYNTLLGMDKKGAI